MATALSEEELDNEDYYSLLNVRREVRLAAGRRLGGGRAGWFGRAGLAATAPSPPRAAGSRLGGRVTPPDMRDRPPTGRSHRLDPGAGGVPAGLYPCSRRPGRRVLARPEGPVPTGGKGSPRWRLLEWGSRSSRTRCLARLTNLPRPRSCVIAPSRQNGKLSLRHQGQGHEGTFPRRLSGSRVFLGTSRF